MRAPCDDGTHSGPKFPEKLISVSFCRMSRYLAWDRGSIFCTFLNFTPEFLAKFLTERRGGSSTPQELRIVDCCIWFRCSLGLPFVHNILLIKI